MRVASKCFPVSVRLSRVMVSDLGAVGAGMRSVCMSGFRLYRLGGPDSAIMMMSPFLIEARAIKISSFVTSDPSIMALSISAIVSWS